MKTSHFFLNHWLFISIIILDILNTYWPPGSNPEGGPGVGSQHSGHVLTVLDPGGEGGDTWGKNYENYAKKLIKRPKIDQNWPNFTTYSKYNPIFRGWAVLGRHTHWNKKSSHFAHIFTWQCRSPPYRSLKKFLLHKISDFGEIWVLPCHI